MVTMLMACLFTLTQAPDYGLMSWYGEPFHGRLTACGEVYDMNGFSVAHRTLPMGTLVDFFYYDPETGRRREINCVYVNDRGPYERKIYQNDEVVGYTRTWDASKALFSKFEDLGEGVIQVGYTIRGYKPRPSMQYNL